MIWSEIGRLLSISTALWDKDIYVSSVKILVIAETFEDKITLPGSFLYLLEQNIFQLKRLHISANGAQGKTIYI